MKEVYIVLTYSGTALSTLIKKFTKDEFAHVSIALDENLEEMYSFGRLNPYNPFNAGFVREGLHCDFFKRFKNTDAAVYSLQIEDEQYNKIKNTISIMKRCNSPYKFNIIGLFGAGLNIRIKQQHSFYCAEFVKYLIDKAKIENDLPEVIKPEDFKTMNLEMKYKGRLQDYELPRYLEVAV